MLNLKRELTGAQGSHGEASVGFWLVVPNDWLRRGTDAGKQASRMGQSTPEWGYGGKRGSVGFTAHGISYT